MNDRRQKVNLVPSARWAAYAAAGAASAIAGTHTAEAGITYVEVNQVIGLDSGVFTFALAGPANLYIGNLQSGAPGSGYAGAALVWGSLAGFGSPGYAANVASGANVASLQFLGGSLAGRMAIGAGGPNSQFTDPGVGFLAFRFDSGNRYGWARVMMNGGPANSFTFIDYAYGDVGDTVFVGQVPAPGCLGLLALGALGLSPWRRQRAA